MHTEDSFDAANRERLTPASVDGTTQMTPLDFLRLLWEFKPAELYILLWTLPDKQSHWFSEIGAVADFIRRAERSDVYVGVGLSSRDHGPSRRCRSGEIAGITGFWADLDLRSDAHSRKALPTTIAEALSIIPGSMLPTIVVSTGNGAHAWWLLKEPYIFDNDDDRQAIARKISRWQSLLCLNASSRGWAYDRLSDLARVLRIPGTRNFKDPANPKDVVVHLLSDRCYNVSDFEEYLDEAAIPDAQTQAKLEREWFERFADKVLVIDSDVVVPQETLDRWMATDARFKNTWLRQRADLRDPTQSGYDLALANFGVDAGLDEQQIVDLIIHHRRQFGQKPRTRLDYFQRTIATSTRRKPIDAIGTRLDPSVGTSESGWTVSEAGEQPSKRGTGNARSADAAIEKALLCQRISGILGVRICRIVKLTGKEPTFHMELEEGKIEFLTVGKLISQVSFREAIAASSGRIIRKFKEKDWNQLAQAILDACTIEQGGEENEWEGAARMYVTQYLHETGFIDSIEEEPRESQRKPTVLEGKVAICASDLQTYISKTTPQPLSVKAVASMLGALGGKSVRIRGQRVKEQGRWVLPESYFDPGEYGWQDREVRQ